MSFKNRFNVADVKSENEKLHGGFNKTNFKTLVVLSLSLLPTLAFSQEPSKGLSELFGALRQIQNGIEKSQTAQPANMPSEDQNLDKSSGSVTATVENFELQRPIRECLSKTKLDNPSGIYSPESRQFDKGILNNYKNAICDQLYNIETSQDSGTQRAFPRVEYPGNCIVANNNWRAQLIEQSQNLVAENERYKLVYKLEAAIKKKCLASLTDEDLINTNPVTQVGATPLAKCMTNAMENSQIPDMEQRLANMKHPGEVVEYAKFSKQKLCEDLVRSEATPPLKPTNCLIKDLRQTKRDAWETCMKALSAEDLVQKNKFLAGKYQALKEKENAEAADQADKQAKAPEERKLAEAKRLERKRVLMAGISGPMLCNINGLSKPTLYLDLGVNNEFKLVTNGTTEVTGKWRSGSFQGQAAILLVPPASPKDSFPDIYTAYEDSIKIDQSSIALTLARRSTFPGSSSAEAYEAICVKAQSLTLVQAKQLTRANQKNNPLRPEALAQRQIAAPQLSADEALACEHAKERCYEKGGVRTAMCLNALRSIRGCD